MSHEPQHRAAEGRDEPSLFLWLVKLNKHIYIIFSLGSFWGPEAVFLSLQPSQAKEEETFLLLSVPPEVKESWVSPSWSARCFPFSGGTTLSSSMSHLLPTMITWALSHEYVLICVALQTHSNMTWAEFHFLSWITGFQPITYQSWTALKDSSLVMSYMRMKPMAPR